MADSEVDGSYLSPGPRSNITADCAATILEQPNFPGWETVKLYGALKLSTHLHAPLNSPIYWGKKKQ